MQARSSFGDILKLLVAYLRVIRSCGIRTFSFRFLFRFLENQPHIETIYYLNYPFFQSLLVIVMRDQTPAFFARLLSLQQNAPIRLSLICIRRRELSRISIPDRFAIEGSYLYWFLQRGALIYGPHIVPTEEPLVTPYELIEFTIEHFLQYSRSHVILSLISSARYLRLMRALDERLTILVSQLSITEGRAPLPGKYLTRSAVEKISNPSLRMYLDRWLQMRQACVLEQKVSQEAALDAAWIFESVIRILRGILNDAKRS